MLSKENLNAIAAERILILDGAMGSLIQTLNLNESDFRGERFANHKIPLFNCMDLLCLTRPDVISDIHEQYLKAGADIIETCSFNSTSVSLQDYGIAELAYEISAASAALARKAADRFSTAEKPRLVAGSMGPTAKSASLPPDMTDPSRRGIHWDELAAAYYDNARGLVDGGADILIIETIFDTLNAKAALFAISRLNSERRAAGINTDIPVIISATVSDSGGRLLSGQNLEAFCVSVIHGNPWALGLNCSFGAEKILPHLENLASIAPCLVSVHPNAGLPNMLGTYDESPETMACTIEKYFQKGLVNIAGGCCGTTPEHIRAIAEMAANYKPRKIPAFSKPKKIFSGLEAFAPESPPGLTIVGERTNVTGSRECLRLITEKKYDKVLTLVRDMIKSGAKMINVGMDDPMLDAEKEMVNFLNLALFDTRIAKVPFMIDSSRWSVIEAGLKCIQGKPVVNSISLKDGEEEFLRQAGLIRRYGAAVVVMLIDERGQALNYERKIEIAGRAFRLLTGSNIGFPTEDIIFDPNILSVATGMSEHDSYALDFIRCCCWIRENCPGVQITGGLSNLSFSFRGNSAVREAMHSVFLKHAVAAGLNMVIANPAALIPYDDINPQLRDAVEDVILNRKPKFPAEPDRRGSPPDASEVLLCIAEKMAADFSPGPNDPELKQNAGAEDDSWRKLDAKGRIVYALVKGLDDYITADVLELCKSVSPAAIIEGPLMEGIKNVGCLFGEGKLYLPQVLRSSMVMKKAFSALEPFFREEENRSVQQALSDGKNAAEGVSLSAKIVLATVKGDVHDIGKNIVGLVLGCNGYNIVDLGVMVPCQKIIETAISENAAAVGVSGLISPSLDEMINIAREMEKRGMKIPLLIGGAAANLAYTALRIAPEYSGPVIYVPDAAQAAGMIRCLLSDSERPGFLESIAEKFRQAEMRHEKIYSQIEIIPLSSARANKIPPLVFVPPDFGTGETVDLNDYPLEKVIPHIDWQSYLQTWELAEKTYPRSYETDYNLKESQDKLLRDTETMLERVKNENLLQLRGILKFFSAASDGDDLVLFESAVAGVSLSANKSEAGNVEIARFCFLRNQEKKRSGAYNPCLADFFEPLDADAPAGSAAKPDAEASAGSPASKSVHSGADRLGLFALSAGFGLTEAVGNFQKQGDDYNAILLAALANTLAEAFAEELNSRFQQGSYAGIRPVFGYPISPDHEDKRLTFKLLDAEKHCGFKLTDSAMMIPAASVCGMIIGHPAAYYFGIGPIGDDQQEDWAHRKGISIAEARRRVGLV